MVDQKTHLTGGRPLYITHEAIFRALNPSREVVSRRLKPLVRLGRVSLSHHKISLSSAA